MIGNLGHPSRFEEELSSVVDALVQQSPEDSDALTALKGDPAGSTDDRYVVLHDAALIFATAQTIEVPVMRVDTERIAAWWLRNTPPDEMSGPDVEEEVTFERVDFRVE